MDQCHWSEIKRFSGRDDVADAGRNMEFKAVTSHLIQHLSPIDDDCRGIDMIVSFIKLSGFRSIEPLLVQAKARHIPVRILTSTYMNITDPAALLALYSLLQPGSVRLYNGPSPSFHPKAYFFKYRHKADHVFVGSSNLSETALTRGVEWNYKIDGDIDSSSYQIFAETFERLYNNEAYPLDHEEIVDYRKNYVSTDKRAIHSDVNRHFIKHQKNKTDHDDVLYLSDYINPNHAQTEALLELKATREAGNDKAIVVAATGVGKTYLAALDARISRTVLFVAHREEILNQSYHAFARVRNPDDLGRFYANYREIDKPVLFASVQSLSRQAHLEKLGKHFFKYVIIDEFHHASARSYQKILSYFKPDFLLGLTATPHRMDKKNIFEICDFNMVYEADLFSAINRGWLCPFNYMGIYDYTVDYGNITYLNGKYAEKELESALSVASRADLIYKHYQAHKCTRTLAFCSTIKHADYMASYFNEHGTRSACVHSDSSSMHHMERNMAVNQLMKGELEIIFSVDMLNEGVDIPRVDLLLFLRPTESATVFLQQLGRGLRLADGKRNLKVLDFIGNYKKVDLIPFLLSRQLEKSGKTPIRADLIDPQTLPINCSINFDLQVIDILTRVMQGKIRLQDKIKSLFAECMNDMQSKPSRVEFYNFLETGNYLEIKSNTKFNPFRDYNSFISTVSPDDVPGRYLNSNAHYLINTIETTSMTALYKIPCILAFFRDGMFRTEATREDIALSFQHFYQNKRNAIDLKNKKSRRNFEEWSLDDYFKLARTNPIKFLSKTHADIFEYDADNEIFRIDLDLDAFKDDDYFLSDFHDALSFRRNEFIDVRLDFENPS